MLKRLLKRPSLNLLAWLLLAAFYISICLNIAFFKQVLQALPLDSLHNVLVFLSMPGNDSNLLIVFYVQIMPDDFVMQLHRF